MSVNLPLRHLPLSTVAAAADVAARKRRHRIPRVDAPQPDVTTSSARQPSPPPPTSPLALARLSADPVGVARRATRIVVAAVGASITQEWRRRRLSRPLNRFFSPMRHSHLPHGSIRLHFSRAAAPPHTSKIEMVQESRISMGLTQLLGRCWMLNVTLSDLH